MLELELDVELDREADVLLEGEAVEPPDVVPAGFDFGSEDALEDGPGRQAQDRVRARSLHPQSWQTRAIRPGRRAGL